MVAAGAAMGAAPSRSFGVLVPSMLQVRPTQELEDVAVTRASSLAAFSLSRTQVVMSEALTSPALTLPPPTSLLHPGPPQIASPRSTLRFAHISCLAHVQC